MSETHDDSEDKPSPFDGLMPSDPVLIPAWAGSLSYAVSRKDVVSAFRKETGKDWTAGDRSFGEILERPEAADLDVVRAFVMWHNENIWGDLDLVAGEGA